MLLMDGLFHLLMIMLAIIVTQSLVADDAFLLVLSFHSEELIRNMRRRNDRITVFSRMFGTRLVYRLYGTLSVSKA